MWAMAFTLSFSHLKPWLYLTLQWYNSNTLILHIFSISYKINVVIKPMATKYRDWQHKNEYIVFTLLCFLLHQYTASNISRGLWKMFWKALSEMPRSCLSWLLEWPECQHSVGLLKLVSVIGIRKNCKVTNVENLAHATIQWFDVLTTILWWKMLYVDVHFCVGGTTSLLPTTQGNDTECSGLNIVVHIFIHLGLQSEA